MMSLILRSSSLLSREFQNFHENKFSILHFHREYNAVFLTLEFMYVVRGKFTDDVSETAVGPIFTVHQ